MDHDTAVLLQGLAFSLAVVGVGLTLHAHLAIQQASKQVNRSYARIILVLIKMMEQYAEIVKNLDTNNQYPGFHDLTESVESLRKEQEKVAAG